MITRDDGEEVTLLVSVAPLRDESGDVDAAVAVFQDITALKELERQRTEFFSVASHEIKTPVTSIHLQLQMLERLIAAGQLERARDMAARAVERSRSLGDLVGDLLEVSRIESGSVSLELRDVDLREIVTSVASSFAGDDAHPIRTLVPEAPVPVRADARRIRETLENLISNALKYSPDGGPIDMEVLVRDGTARVRVRDRGFGVPPADQPYIFDRFYRTSRAAAYGGVGLGLFISREFATRHGGALELESSSERGSTFVLSLPLAAVPDPAPRA
jgi:signal transduction histidine kinase